MDYSKDWGIRSDGELLCKDTDINRTGATGFVEVGHGYNDNEFYMQFTGLLDNNGKEIYEGDIIKNPEGSNGEVFWSVSSWMTTDRHIGGSNYTWSQLEVIGNIYENPELLNQG